MNKREFDELAAGFVLNALSPADRVAFETARAAHPEWESEIAVDLDTVASLAIDELTPPPSARTALLDAISVTPQQPAAGPEQGVTRGEAADDAVPSRRWTRTIFTLAASLALVAVIGYGAISLSSTLNRPAAVVALQEITEAADAQTASAETGDAGSVTVHWSQDVGQAVVETRELPAITDEQDFELWLVRDSGPVSAGTFHPDGDSATVVLGGDLQPGDVVAITVEPLGGSPTGAPSTDPIVAIPTA